MAFCTSCGSQNPDAAAHCTSCGAVMAAVAPAQTASMGGMVPPAAAAPAQPPAPRMVPPMAAAPAQPMAPSFLQQLIASLDTGAKVAGVGGLVAAVAFFLPLYENVNGVDMAQGDVSWWFRLLLALAAVGLLYFVYNNDLRTKIIVATAHVGIGAMWGFQLLHIMRGGEYTGSQQFGWYFLHLGLLAIFVGGVMSIMQDTKRLAGVR